MRAIDVCAGAGLFSLGLADAGFEVHGVELDPDAAETHRANVGPCDTADVAMWSPTHDAVLVGGGVPCQPFSEAGRRGGFLDSRGVLFRSLLRIALESHAEAVVLENVRGMVSWADAGGRAIDQVVAAFRAAGFATAWAILDAVNYGVPQRRKRVFVVGFADPKALGAFRWPSATHARTPNLFGLPAFATVREALELGDGAFATGRIDGASGWQGQRFQNVDTPSNTLGTRNNADLLSRIDSPAPTILANKHDETIGKRRGQRPLAELTRDLGRAGFLDQPARAVTAGGTESGGGAEPFANRDYREALVSEMADAGLIDRPSTTVLAAAGGRLLAAGHHDSMGESFTKRMPLAWIAKLQDFPDGFVFHGNKSSQHRQVGNAVPRRLGAAVGRSIRAALDVAHAMRGAA